MASHLEACHSAVLSTVSLLITDITKLTLWPQKDWTTVHITWIFPLENTDRNRIFTPSIQLERQVACLYSATSSCPGFEHTCFRVVPPQLPLLSSAPILALIPAINFQIVAFLQVTVIEIRILLSILVKRNFN